jgi:5-bromo-4-chloroindolyl phosphate hydrolysis protein
VRAFFYFIVRSGAAVLGTVTIFLVALVSLGQAFLLSLLYAVLGGSLIYFLLRELQYYRVRKRLGLSKREYKFIQRNLREAKQKISRLQRALLRVRTVSEAKENFELVQTVWKIYTNTKRDPKRFFQAENFYYKNIDSLTELAEKYAFLSSQPAKTKEIIHSLKETEHTIRILGDAVKKDLHIMLNDDMDTLHFELDVAKQSYKKMEKE